MTPAPRLGPHTARVRVVAVKPAGDAFGLVPLGTEGTLVGFAADTRCKPLVVAWDFALRPGRDPATPAVRPVEFVGPFQLGVDFDVVRLLDGGRLGIDFAARSAAQQTATRETNDEVPPGVEGPIAAGL